MTRRPPTTDDACGPSGLTVEARPWAGGTVLELHGELDLDSVGELQAALDAALAVPVTAVVLDCADLDFCDSAGLNALLRAQARAGAEGSRIELAGPRPLVLRMLELTGAGSAFPIRDAAGRTAGHLPADHEEGTGP